LSTPATSVGLTHAWTVLREAARSLRIHQWVKNLLVFAAPLLAHDLAAPGALVHITWVFAAFCAAASGVYVINDLLDLQADRAHPRKRNRPFASGRLPLAFGVMGPVLLVAGVVVALSISRMTGLVLIAYVVTSIGYSMYLKTQPLVDVFTLSMLYTIRLYAGQVALDVEPSVWLLSFSGFLFLALAFVKRVSEYEAISRSGTTYNTRRGYSESDIALLKTMGMGSTFASSVVLALYINSETAAQAYRNVSLLWSVVPILLFWQARMWLAASRGKMSDDPIVYAARDWVSQLCLALLIVVAALAAYA
jgi:4-hydroxybenzoate polyprenyltransferase